MGCSQRAAIWRHMKGQTGERELKCLKCERAFTQSDNLKTHERMQKGEKPFSYLKCDKAFNLSGYFQKHKKILKKVLSFSLFACSKCDERSAANVDLEKHDRTHTGVKSFAWSKREQTFKW